MYKRFRVTGWWTVFFYRTLWDSYPVSWPPPPQGFGEQSQIIFRHIFYETLKWCWSDHSPFSSIRVAKEHLNINISSCSPLVCYVFNYTCKCKEKAATSIIILRSPQSGRQLLQKGPIQPITSDAVERCLDWHMAFQNEENELVLYWFSCCRETISAEISICELHLKRVSFSAKCFAPSL